MITVTYEDIVTERSRPTLVRAGPGAGKTYLLGDRVKRLLNCGVSHSTITVLAFGKDASQNMRNKLLDPKHGFGLKYSEMPRVSTMHSLGYEIVNAKPHAVRLRKKNLRVQADPEVTGLLFRDAALRAGLADSDGLVARRCKAHGDCGQDDNEGMQISHRRCISSCRGILQNKWLVKAKCYIIGEKN
jgi:hypothetical protein